MDTRKINVFVLGTEYHFLLAMFIIEDRFSSDEYLNKLVFLGKRLSQIDSTKLPHNIVASDFFFDAEKKPLEVVREKILNGNVENLFMVNVYRAADTLIVSSAAKSTKVHLMQDGALFYHRIEKTIFKSRIKETFRIYTSIWKKGIFFTDVLWYGRFMETSNYIQEVWMTNPREYVGPPTDKKVNLIKYFGSPGIVERVNSYFVKDDSLPYALENYLIYLSPIIKVPEHADIEVANLKILLQQLGLKNILIKLHPNTPDFHLSKLKQAFGESVIKNYVPAEVYISRAKDSIVVGCASTSLFYNNPRCRYYGLKEFFQQLGIYAKWKNINLPPHVIQVQKISDLEQAGKLNSLAYNNE